MIEETLTGDNYRLRLPERMRIHPIFHVSLLDETQNPETKEDLYGYDEEFLVESIQDQRTRKGIAEYYIKWTGYDESENTWEPVTHLHCPEKSKEFEERRKKRGDRHGER